MMGDAPTTLNGAGGNCCGAVRLDITVTVVGNVSVGIGGGFRAGVLNDGCVCDRSDVLIIN